MTYRTRSKYGVYTDAKGREDRTVDNVTFASKREAVRYVELRASQNAGIIRDLVLQPKFPLIVNGEKICVYVADFRYVEARTGKTIIEDAKGARTALYGLKSKLFNALYAPLRITEV